MKTTNASRLVMTLCLLAGAPVPAHADDACRMISIDEPDAVAAQGGTVIYGVNSEGLVTGNWYDGNGTSHGLLWRDGKFQSVDHPNQGPYGLTLYYANSHGEVAGNYYDGAGISHSVIYDSQRDRFEQLADFPGASFNAAGAIDNQGRVAGNYTLDPYLSVDFVAWLYDGAYDYFVAAASDQGRLGTLTYGMNNHGTIAGYYIDAGGRYHGMTRAVGEDPVPFDVPGASRTVVMGINDQGLLAGQYKASGVRHGFVFRPGHGVQPGTVNNHDFPGVANTHVAGISDNGDISGYYIDANGYFHGFVGFGCERQ
jgi:hypothetical protein